mgnify:CR=1 FL=1|jgi:hypothetical protein
MILQQMYTCGKLIGQYKISKNNIADINKKYEKAKHTLKSYGPKLAGRLDSELDLMPIIANTTAFKSITKSMDNYIDALIKTKLLPPGAKHLEIIGCWVNDMVRGEYNPLHTHNDAIGFSTVLFLKVPKFINDVKDPHKFKDGILTFVSPNGEHILDFVPKVGDFFIFQANHMHTVNPFKTKNVDEVRRSMSFNFVIKENK